MIFFKVACHCRAIIQKIVFILIYGKGITWGKNVTWRRRFSIMKTKDSSVKIGDDCFFNNDCTIDATNYISIGPGTIFGENVKIYDHNHKFANSDIPIKEQGYSSGSVNIGKHCWIGSNVVILKNSNIGDNCVIGAGCVISGNIESNVIVKKTDNYIITSIRENIHA